MRTRSSAWLGSFLLLAALAARGAEPPLCEGVPQSPRNVNPRPPSPYDERSRNSMVVKVGPEERWVDFQLRPTDSIQRLVLCGQHYHAPVETVQGCPGETEVIVAPPARPGAAPGPGQWIEVHTVYAPHFKEPCDDFQDLSCCVGAPVLVRGFSAKVVDGSADGPIRTPGQRPLAEWSGSNTGPDSKAGECKPIRAEWSFLLTSCKTPPTITRAQLEKQFPCTQAGDQAADKKCGWQGARVLQGGARVSKPLTCVVSDDHPCVN